MEDKGEKPREHTEFDPYLISGGAGVHATDGGEEIVKAASSGWGRRRRAKPCPEDVVDWRTHSVIQTTCPGSQLALVTLSLLQGICRAEVTPASSTQVPYFSYVYYYLNYYIILLLFNHSEVHLYVKIYSDA